MRDPVSKAERKADHYRKERSGTTSWPNSPALPTSATSIGASPYGTSLGGGCIEMGERQPEALPTQRGQLT